MSNILHRLPRPGVFAVLLLGIALAGILGAGFLSAREYCSAGTCPSIGIPACYVVFAAYVLIFASVFAGGRTPRRAVFLAGILPVLGLAFAGSSMQAAGLAQCPRTSSGIPMCYISLGMSLAIIALFILNERAHGRREQAGTSEE